jgi:hypothetical protein
MTTTYYRYNALTRVLTAEPRYIVLADGSVLTNPSASQYATLRDAYPRGADAPQNPPEGKVAGYAAYALGEDKEWHRQWAYDDAPPPPPRVWTPLSIKRACGERWSAVRAALEAAGIYEDFVMAQELREDDSAFQMGYQWAVTQYGKETVDAVLAAAEGGN